MGASIGNLGALLRTADAYGISPVLLLSGTADPLGPKAVRGSMGALFHIAVAAGLDPEAALAALRRRDYRILAAVARGGDDPDRASLTHRLMPWLRSFW